MPRDRSLSVKLRADVSNYLAGIRQAGNATREFSGKAADSVDKHRAAWKKVGDSATGAGLAIGAGLALAVVKFAEFDQAMSAASAASRATGTELEALRDLAMRLGKDTQYSATEAAQGITEMAKAGVATKDIINGGLKGALSLAAAGQLEVGRAAEIAATAMNQFGLAGKDLPHVADLFAAAAGKAQGSAEDVAQAMKFVGPVAKSLGVSIEETTGIIAEFASKGIIGEQAGTSFRGMLLSLTSPSAMAKKQMDALGLSLYDAQGKFVGMATVAEQMKVKLGVLTEEERNAALGRIFGNEQITAATVLYQGGAAAVQEWTNAVNDSGFAAEQAAALTDNLKGDLERLGGAIDTALIQGGSGANTALRGLVQTLDGAVSAFAELPAPLQATATALAAVSAAALLGVGAFGSLVPKIAAGKAAMVEMGIVSEAAASKLALTAKNAGLLSAAAVGLGVAGNAMQGVWQKALGASNDAVKSLDAYITLGKDAEGVSWLMRRGFEDLGQQVDQVFNGSIWHNAMAALGEIGTGFGLLGTTQADDAIAFFAQLDTALSGFVQGGKADQAVEIFEKVSREAQAQGYSLAQLREALPQYAAALAVASTDANSAATAQELVTTAITDSKTALDDYMESLKDAGMVQLTANQAARDFEAAIDNAAESLKRNGKTLDIHTPKGRANAEALDAIARAAQDSAEAIYKQTGNQDAAKASLEKGRIALINAAIQMGMTKTAAEKYAESVLKIPATVSTKASLDTREAMAKRNDLLSPGVLRITAHISGTNLEKMYGRGYADGGIVKRADGGIDGNGTYVDRVPQVARRRNILWGETDIPWEAYISGKPEMRDRNMGILRETLRLMKVSPSELASLQFANGAYLAATRPNVAAAAVGAAPTVSVVVENPWTGEQVQAVVRSVVVDGIAQQARTQRRDFRAGVA